MSTHITPTQPFTKAIPLGLFLVVLVVFMSSSPVMAQGISGAGTVFRTDGTKGHFIVGSFKTQESCQKRVFNIFEYLKDQAQWAGENISYRIHGCGTAFEKGTIYDDLKNLGGVKNYILFHPNFRMLIDSPMGKAAERDICSNLTGYFETLLGEKAVCIAPGS